MHKRKNNIESVKCCFIIILILSCMGLWGCGGSNRDSMQTGFNSDQEAVSAFVNALRENDKEKLSEMLGPEGKDVIWSGDEISDRHGYEIFLKAYDEKNSITAEGDKKILVVGKDDWPFPIPIINSEGKWMFDTASGKEEILNRRIGRNELETIEVMLAIVDAQREYAMQVQHNDGVRQYAQKFRSDPGKKNGLYWETNEGEEPSPLGPMFEDAKEEGYFAKEPSKKPSPYHGYFYRMLTAQGEYANGDAFDYIVKGKMIGGFAVLAYPADYGNSGVMSFIVNHDGVVYQKDLGEGTKRKAKKINRFDPDKTWKKVQ